MGDRSENAAYIYGKKQLREIDARIRYLSKRLDEIQVVDRLPADTSRVYFGAWVELEDEAGERSHHRIVGADEIDASGRFVSVDSPLARGLMKRTLDDEVTVETPAGPRTWIIIDVQYEQFSESCDGNIDAAP